jgi:hypothetical protein
VVVSEDVAARTWPGEDPIGKRVKLGGLDSEDAWRTVIGVARPTRYRELRMPRATLYLPAEQFMVTAEMLVLRTASPLTLVARLARERVRAVDPDVHVARVAPFRELLQGPLARPRFNALLIGVFGLAALFLAAIGLYAVMGASVRQRHQEIGVRVALGATASGVFGLVIGEGLETVLAAATRLDYRDEPLRPAWAALSNGGLKKFPIISGVERLVVLADNDANNAGAKAAEACKRRWLEAGRRVALLDGDLGLDLRHNIDLGERVPRLQIARSRFQGQLRRRHAQRASGGRPTVRGSAETARDRQAR